MTSPEGGRHEAGEEKVHWGVDCEEYVWDWVHQEHPQGEAAATVVVVLLYLYKGEKSRDESEPGPTVLSWLIDCFRGYLRLERSIFVCCCLGLGWKGSRKPGLGWSTSTYGMIFFFGFEKYLFCSVCTLPLLNHNSPITNHFFPALPKEKTKQKVMMNGGADNRREERNIPSISDVCCHVGPPVRRGKRCTNAEQ